MPPKKKGATPKRTPKRGKKAPQDVHYPGGGLVTSFQGLSLTHRQSLNVGANYQY